MNDRELTSTGGCNHSKEIKLKERRKREASVGFIGLSSKHRCALVEVLPFQEWFKANQKFSFKKWGRPMCNVMWAIRISSNTISKISISKQHHGSVCGTEADKQFVMSDTCKYLHMRSLNSMHFSLHRAAQNKSNSLTLADRFLHVCLLNYSVNDLLNHIG